MFSPKFTYFKCMNNLTFVVVVTYITHICIIVIIMKSIKKSDVTYMRKSLDDMKP